MRQGQLRAVLGYLHRVAHSDIGGPEDAQLLDRWRTQRDPAAFEVLVWRHGTTVWNVCRRILVRDQDVEDAFQATFLTFLRKADTVGQGQFLGSWLYKVAYRTALAARATAIKHAVSQKSDADVPEPAVIEGDDWAELGPVLDEEVNRLPEKYRLPFVLCYLEGKTTDEAAHDLSCPRGTVGSRLAWARERLRSRLTRGLTLSVAGLATLLSEKAAMANVPSPLVLSIVQAATFSTAGNAVAAGVISARTVALTQGVLQTMFVTKLKTIAVILLSVGLLGSGAGLLTHQALADRPGNETRSLGDKETRSQANDSLAALSPSERVDEEEAVAIEEDKVPALKDKVAKVIDPPQISGTVERVDRDGKILVLSIPSKIEVKKVEIKMTDKTLLVFTGVGPNEAKLTEGYGANVWLEKDSKDVAARLALSGKRNAPITVLNTKAAPHQAGRVVAVAADGKGMTLEKLGKGEQPAEKITIQFTDNTRVSFSNVIRDGARPTVGYEGRVWLEDNSADTARSVMFVGDAEGKPATEGKGSSPDRSGRIVGVSGNGKTQTVEILPAKKDEPSKIAIKFTDATRVSYHGVAVDGAKPVVGYEAQIWLAEGSQDTAARARIVRYDPRKSVDVRILAVSADGSRITFGIASKGGGEPIKREIKITAKTRMVFSNVGLGGAKLTEGYHVSGWLVEGSEDTADELMVSRPELAEGKKPDDKKEK